MKTIGLIGGMSFESTLSYYKIINEEVNLALGELHSAKILLYSVDFAQIEEYQAKGEWNKSANYLADIAATLEKAGADFIAICTNTMHKIAPQIKEKIQIPILHIASATADEIKRNNIKKIALLGTKYTMIQDFYKRILIDCGIEVIIPSQADIEIVNDIIYNELCAGIINGTSKEKYVKIINKMEMQGAQGVILGCTEIGLLISQSDTTLQVFDTALIHAKSIAQFALVE